MEPASLPTRSAARTPRFICICMTVPFTNTAGTSEVGKEPRKVSGVEGQSLTESTLILPLLFLLIVNVVNFGGFFYAWITVANSVRTGAQYAVLNSASVGSLTPATGAQISALITQDTASLPNKASVTVNVCQNNNGTITTLTGTCTGIASDPEPASYVLTAVDVTYTYQPFIPLFDFPALHIHATLPPTSIHRRAYMRVIN
jgi:hypothetical protein